MVEFSILLDKCFMGEINYQIGKINISSFNINLKISPPLSWNDTDSATSEKNEKDQNSKKSETVNKNP